MTFDSYPEFFPFYVAAHSRRATRWIHFAGTTLGVLVALVGLVVGPWYLIALAPVVGYGFAWFSHFVIEENRPASFGHPLYSLRGDWHMFALMLTGQDSELDAIARAWHAEHPDSSTRRGVPAGA